jgi:hypothetical protein
MKSLTEGRLCGWWRGLPLRRVVAAAAILLANSSVRAQTGPFQFYPLTPCRVIDTRTGMGGSQLTAAIQQNLWLKSHCAIPSSARAVAFNAALLTPTADGYLAIWQFGVAFPGTSLINARAGDPAVANGGLVLVGTGNPDVSVVYGTAGGGTAHLVLDVTGYYQ